MEWKVLWGSGYVPKTALIQICDKKMILLIQISSMESAFPILHMSNRYWAEVFASRVSSSTKGLYEHQKLNDH
jgi:hypothetical protein